jgi:hypothetical protein
MKFNINDYKGKYAMYCKTEEAEQALNNRCVDDEEE